MGGNILLACLTAVAIFNSSFGSPIDPFNLEDEILRNTKADSSYRLPGDVVPESYVIKISDINFQEGTFKGKVEIVIGVLKEISEVKIHAVNLKGITKENVRLTKQSEDTPVNANEIVQADGHEIMTLKFDTPLTESEKYILEFTAYTGSLLNGMSGFYRSKYVENDETEWMGTTQMQATSARKVFPCFDEPSYKATFKLTIERPANYSTSFSNMLSIMLREDSKTDVIADVFEPTPIMSTYLLAFIVSKYEVLDSIDTNDEVFRILARKSAQGQSEHAFDEGKGLTKAMSKYMNLDYYKMGNIKMDQAAIPDFSAGAMENWGLVTYREAYLLANESETNVRYRQLISTILAHEIAHMWFGNYLTCHWWSDTWLNEGFANFFEYKMPDLEDDTLDYDLKTQYPVIVVQRALLADTPIRSSPLSNENINSPTEISAHFSTITYSKGGSVIRMIEHWMGEANFKDALNTYMTENENKAVTPESLYSALQSKAPQGLNVSAVFSSWVEKSGFPVIQADIDYDNKKMNLTQKRFKKAWEAQPDTLYQVPITYATKSKSDFDNTTTDFMLTGAELSNLNIEIDGHEWLVLNKKQIGFYRVNYDSHSWGMLRSVLLRSGRTEIHQVNRAQIVDDLLNLAREEYITYNQALDVLDFLRVENEYGPWQAAFPGLSFIRQQLSINSTLAQRFDAHILNLMKNVTETLGFGEEGDSLLTKLFRLNTMNFACALEHEECVNYANEAFKNFTVDGKSVPANHREFVYCTGLRRGNQQDFEKLWDKYKGENIMNEKMVILGALGCTKNESSIRMLLDDISDKDSSAVRDQDIMTPINAILNGNLENVEYVLKYLEDDFEKLRPRLGSYSTLLANLGARLTGNQIGRFYNLIMDNAASMGSAELTAGLTAYNNLILQNDYVRKSGMQIDAWLTKTYDNSAGLAQSSVLLMCAMYLLQLFYNKY